MRRAVILSGVGFVLMTLLAPLWNVAAFAHVAVDIPVIIVVFVALSGRQGGFSRASVGPTSAWVDLSGVATVLMLGYAADVLGGAPKGLHALSLAIVYLISRGVGRRIFLAGAVAQLSITAVAAGVTVLVALGFHWAGGVPASIHVLPAVAGQVILTALAAPPLMSLLRFVDAKTLRRPLGVRST